MKKTVYVAIAAALCLLAGCKEKELTEYEKGMEKLEQQKYEKAVRHFENAIEKGDSTPGGESALPEQSRGLMRKQRKPLQQLLR